MAEVLVAVLLGAAVLVAALSCVGLLRGRDLYDRLHWVTPIGTASAGLVTVAVGLTTGFGQELGKSAALAVVLTVGNAVIGHATARAARIRDRGRWEPPSSGDESARAPEE